MSVPALSSTAGRRSLRHILRIVHLWIGLGLGAPLVLLGLTGSVLVLEDELRGLLDRAPPTAVGMPHGLDEVLAAATAKAPKGARPTFLFVPERPGDWATVRFAVLGAPPGPGGLQIRVDPVSLATFSAQPSANRWLRWIHMFHAQLLVPGREGRSVVGWFGVAMVALGFSGVIMWWPRRGRWKRAFGIARGARGFRLYRGIHGMVGIWCWLVFMAVSASSLYLTFPKTVSSIVGSVFPLRDLSPRSTPRVTAIPGGSPMNLDRAVALASDKIGGAAVRFVSLPQRPDQPIRISMTVPGTDRGAPAISVFVDPWTGRVMEIRDPRHYSFGEKLIAWQHAIHSGNAMGWIWRLLVFLSGLLPALFVATGCAMWLCERRQARRRRSCP
jgi:uncharacterized iron-regulated membrane protein